MLKKIEKMYAIYGKAADGLRCSNCSNYCRYTYRDKPYRKCSVYGISCSEATDWTGKWRACGRMNRPLEGTEREVIKRKAPIKEPEDVIEGQMSIFDIDKGLNK